MWCYSAENASAVYAWCRWSAVTASWGGLVGQVWTKIWTWLSSFLYGPRGSLCLASHSSQYHYYYYFFQLVRISRCTLSLREANKIKLFLDVQYVIQLGLHCTHWAPAEKVYIPQSRIWLNAHTVVQECRQTIQSNQTFPIYPWSSCFFCFSKLMKWEQRSDTIKNCLNSLIARNVFHFMHIQEGSDTSWWLQVEGLQLTVGDGHHLLPIESQKLFFWKD